VVEVLLEHLHHPWGITFAPDGTMFFTERGGGWYSLQSPYTADPTPVQYNADGLYVNGETGLLDIEVDPNYASNRRIFTCQGVDPAGAAAPRIQVISWTMFANNARVRKIRVLVNNVTTFGSQVGRHGGCRLEFDGSGNLFIGTGDGATANNPQNLTTLGGKVLRVDPDTGAGLPNNPWGDHPNANRRRIWNYGHRNIQGLTRRPGTNGQLWSVEHGSSEDDELNRVIKGRNYGWAPRPPYDESVPMTDQTRFPNAVTATWSSGFPTIAPSGADFIEGAAWGPWNGALAVGVLKNTELKIFRLAANGALLGVDTPPELNIGERLRTPVMGPGNALFITTDESPGQILRVTPVP
jgi:aldose sugar dehydrogenase